ncbi:uridine kinase [candidate division KSB1 bacterium]|nr:MAG: uridine kinase [candidate division KSB1 bacterium]
MRESSSNSAVRGKRAGHSHTGSHLIGICGGSGSGKTLVASSVRDALGTDNVLLMEQDSYYRDLSHLPLGERHKVNFDHPSAFDNDLLLDHLHALLGGNAVRMPEYDYTQHTRSNKVRDILPCTVILLDGILVFEDPRLREIMDIRVYVDTDMDIRLARRIRRDIAERGRELMSVLEQWETQVRPMHDQFVEPFKRYADIIIPQGGMNTVAVDMLVTKVQSIVGKK